MRSEVFYRTGELDGRSQRLLAKLAEILPGKIRKVGIVEVFITSFDLPPATAKAIFSDPVAQDICADTHAADGLRFAGWTDLIEVAFRPGVTDTLAITAREALEYELGKRAVEGQAVQSAVQYLLEAEALSAQDRKALEAFLFNPLIQSCVHITRDEWLAGTRSPALYPLVKAEASGKVEFIDVAAMDDEALLRLSKDRLLALTLEEMHAVRDWFASKECKKARSARKMKPLATDVELEMIAQTWSEHCKHKIFNAEIDYAEGGKKETIKSVFKTFIKSTTDELWKKKPFLRSVFKDDSGVVAFDEDTLLCIKAETHNSPSALDPYGGAITGIVGVNRDIMGTGRSAKPIFNTNVLCFGYPNADPATIPDGLLQPRDLLAGVHKGIIDGGNQSGIPTVGGAFLFDPSFTGKPLVFCGTGGIMPAKIAGEDAWVKVIEAGDRAVMVGGRIGKDGIHGATFSSLELNESSPVSAVQIGDPIIQRKMMDFMLEARDQGLFKGQTDNGAGGLSSSLGEMARTSGGVRIDLDACPLKYPGLAPWEILVSESQERMSLAVKADKLDAFMALAARRDVEATVVGEFTASGFVEILSGGKEVGLLSLDFLHDGLPDLKLRAEWKESLPVPAEVQAAAMEGRNLLHDALAVLADPNVASKEALVRQYDHEVQAMSVEKPFAGLNQDAPSDGAVIAPKPGSNRGVTITHGICPRYSPWDTYRMAQCAVDEAFRAHIALGGDPDEASGLDNFCWPDPVESPSAPDGAYKLAQLVRACRGLKEACVAYGIPLVSGKDSMKNDATMKGKKLSVKPTLLFTLMGIVKDVRKTVSTAFAEPGDLIYLLGDTRGELGGSIYEGLVGAPLGECPAVNPAKALELYKKLHRAISGKLVASCHDLSDGGLWVALAESCLGGRLGAMVDLKGIHGGSGPEPARLLFCESASRLLVSVRAADRERFDATLAGSVGRCIGKVTERNRIEIRAGDKELLDVGMKDVEKAFKTPIA